MILWSRNGCLGSQYFQANIMERSFGEGSKSVYDEFSNNTINKKWDHLFLSEQQRYNAKWSCLPGKTSRTTLHVVCCKQQQKLIRQLRPIKCNDPLPLWKWLETGELRERENKDHKRQPSPAIKLRWRKIVQSDLISRSTSFAPPRYWRQRKQWKHQWEGENLAHWRNREKGKQGLSSAFSWIL